MAEADSVAVVCVRCKARYWLWPDDPRAKDKTFECRECEQKLAEGDCAVCRGPCQGH